MGGNIFNKTGPIKKQHIEPTLNVFYQQLGSVFPNASKYFKSIQTLGSVGKKEYSGDIDLALSSNALKNIKDWGLQQQTVQDLFNKFKKRARTATDDQLRKRAVIVAIADKIQESNTDIKVDTKGSGSGTLFLSFPQYNQQKQKQQIQVQIDINVGDIDWLSFAYYSNTYKGNIKGLHRTQLMLALYSNKGYTFSHNYGVKQKNTGEIVATTPRQAIELLSKIYEVPFTKEIIQDYFKLIEFLKNNIQPSELEDILDIYIKILDRTRADIPEDLQKYWVDNQQRLRLTGKFLPDDSKLIPFKTQ